ncbi:MAG: Ig-like domain-containing protein [Pseudomonadota bacterium]
MVNVLDEAFNLDTGFSKSSGFFVEVGGLEFLGIYDPANLASDFDGAATAPDAGFVGAYTGFAGLFLTGSDLNGAGARPSEVSFTWSSIDVSGLHDISFSGLFASLPDAVEGPDAGDYIIVEVAIDGGGYTSLLDFRADAANGEFRLDTNSDGVGDGAALNAAAQSFTQAITSASVSSLSLRLRVKTDGAHEDFAVDNFVVSGTANTAPVARNDALSAGENAPLSNGSLFANNGSGADSDANGDTLTITAVNGQAGNVGSQFALGSGALLTVGANGAVSYNANNAFESLAAGQSATESFTYTISDGFGGTSTATATVTINGANDAPDARNDVASTDKNSATSGNVFANNGSGADTDIDAGDSFIVTAVNGGGANVGSQIELDSGALVTVNENGAYTYDPNGAFVSLGAGQNGTDSFTYAISDGDSTDTATVTINISGANNAPVARDDAFTASEDAPRTGVNLLANNGAGADTDVNSGDVLRITAVNGGGSNVGSQIELDSGALVTVNENGAVSYDANDAFESLRAGQNATDTFQYTLSDGNGGTDTASVTVTINGANDAPDAKNDALSTNEDSATSGNLLVNNGAGADSDVDDGDTLTVSAVNGQSGNVNSQIALASGALLRVNADGSYTYDPNGKFETLSAGGASGVDSFTYQVSDGKGGFDTATATISISGRNDAPVAANDAFSTNENSTVTGNVLASNGGVADSDIDAGDTLRVTKVNGASISGSVTLASGATVSMNASGAFSYNPGSAFDNLAQGASASESFVYEISDGKGGVDTATATITVNGLNDAPVARNDSLSTTEKSTSSGNLFADNGGGADTDIDDSDSFTITSVNGLTGNVGGQITTSKGALVTVNADGSYTYNPNGRFTSLGDGASSSDSFTYEITDAGGLKDTATATIAISGVNDAPTARADNITVSEDGGGSGDLFADNGAGADSDPDSGDVLTVTAVNGAAGNVGADVTLASGAVVTISADGSLAFASNGRYESLGAGASATETVNYTISDGKGGTSTATATINIVGVNDAPTPRNDAFSVSESGTVAGNVLTGDSDVDNGDALRVSAVAGSSANLGRSVTLPSGALLTISANGALNYDPNGAFDFLIAGATGTDTFAYTASDGAAAAVATVTVTVTGEAGGVLEGDNNANTLTGTNFADTLYGLGGADRLSGAEGGDLLDGGAGGDTLLGGVGNDQLIGGIGFDRLFGEFDDDTLSGGRDNDYLDGGLGDDFLNGNLGNDQLWGRGGDDELNGGAGQDLIFGNPGDDTLRGGGGADSLFGGFGDDTLFGGSGDDKLNGEFDNDELYGEDGNDRLKGSSGDDTLFGGAGADTLLGDDGADSLFGDDGVDILIGGLDNDTLTGGRGNDRLFGEAGADELNGSADNDFIDGGNGADLLQGNRGNDQLWGRNGADTINGGAGHDLAFANQGDDLVNGNGGRDSLFGGFGDDTLNGGGGNDRLNGEADDDELYGNDGNDTLLGSEGHDRLFGGTGADTLEGGDGDDTLDGQEDDDVVNGGAGDDILAGNVGNDTVSGGDGLDIVSGGDGDDMLFGNAGIDELFGGIGNDTLDGGDDADALNGNDGEDLIIGGAGDDTAFGGAGDDELRGGAGDDELIGNSGADTLQGGLGDDTLLGGGGIDTFIFSRGDGNDQFSDFVTTGSASELIQLSGFGADFDTFDEVLAAASADGFGNTVIDFGQGDTITLLTASIDGLSADDFLFT